MNHRWWRRAGRQEMGTKRYEAHRQNGADDQEILQDRIIPLGQTPATSRFSRAKHS
jgi:hypothetical protein